MVSQCYIYVRWSMVSRQKTRKVKFSSCYSVDVYQFMCVCVSFAFSFEGGMWD